jgi:hypothetical protein
MLTVAPAAAVADATVSADEIKIPTATGADLEVLWHHGFRWTVMVVSPSITLLEQAPPDSPEPAESGNIPALHRITDLADTAARDVTSRFPRTTAIGSVTCRRPVLARTAADPVPMAWRGNDCTGAVVRLNAASCYCARCSCPPCEPARIKPDRSEMDASRRRVTCANLLSERCVAETL